MGQTEFGMNIKDSFGIIFVVGKNEREWARDGLRGTMNNELVVGVQRKIG